MNVVVVVASSQVSSAFPSHAVVIPQIVDNGGLEIVSEDIVTFSSEALVCRMALSLFRNICANDVYKTKLVNEGGLRLILGCMQEHKTDKLLQVLRATLAGER